MDRGVERTQRFRDEVADVLRAWERDRANLGNFWRKFFGSGVEEPSGKSVEQLFSRVLTSAVAAAPTAAGTAAHGGLFATAASIGVGFVTYGVKTASQLIKQDRESPYRYLTLMQKAGVTFRADLRKWSSG